jgi:hypothetical protein
MTRYQSGRQYRLDTNLVGVGSPDEMEFDLGECFTFRKDLAKEYGGIFVAERDGAVISHDVVRKYEKISRKPMFVEVA